MELNEQGSLVSFGPFSDNASYVTSKINFFLRLIGIREMYAERPVDAYLIHRHLADTLVPMLDHTPQTSFYLKHMDDKGDHILFDDNFNITAIIDWEWAQTRSKADAFAAPLLLLDVGALYDGDNTLSPDEMALVEIYEGKARPDMAFFVRNGRIQHRIALCIGGYLEDDAFHSLFEGFLKLQERPITWEEWRSETMEKYDADEDDPIHLIEEEKGRRETRSAWSLKSL